MRRNAHSAVVHGPDEHGLGAALTEEGFDVARLEGPTDADMLTAAGVETATYFVLTDVGEASAIPVAKELAPEITVVVYDDDSLPEYVAGVADLAVDPALLAASVVAEELG